MPNKPDYKGFYKRNDGAYIKQGNKYKKVGCDKYKKKQHYSQRNIESDKKRKARSPNQRDKLGHKYTQLYPHAYDTKNKKV